jgi:hydrogenase-4 component B
LGTGRSLRTSAVKEVSFFMLLPQYLIVTLILLVGFYPSLFVQPISLLTSEIAHTLPNTANLYPIQKIEQFLQPLSIFLGMFIGIVSFLLIIKYLTNKNKQISYAPTWGCGYTAATPKVQYTSTSFADNLLMFSGKVIDIKKRLKGTYYKKVTVIKEEEIFPTARSFKVTPSDVVEEYIYNIPVAGLISFLKKAAVVQTGNIQTYLLYAFLFLLSMVILTVLKII